MYWRAFNYLQLASQMRLQTLGFNNYQLLTHQHLLEVQDNEGQWCLWDLTSGRVYWDLVYFSRLFQFEYTIHFWLHFLKLLQTESTNILLTTCILSCLSKVMPPFRFRFPFPHSYMDSYVITVKMLLKVGANLLTIYVGSMSEVVVAGESIDASHHYGTSLPLNSPNVRKSRSFSRPMCL